jgi:hypothetical protein
MGMEIQIYIYFFMPMESLGKLGLSSFYKFKAKSISPHAFLVVFTSSRLRASAPMPFLLFLQVQG